MPLTIIPYHGIQNCHHFSHAGGKCNFLVLTLLAETSLALPATSWSAIVAAMTATLYFLTAFVAGYIRDLRVHRALRTPALFHLDLLRAQAWLHFSTSVNVQNSAAWQAIEEVKCSGKQLDSFTEKKQKLEARMQLYIERGDIVPQEVMAQYVALGAEMVSSSSSQSAIAALSESDVKLEHARKRIDLLFGVVGHTQMIEHIRLSVEFWLPIIIAVFAFGSGAAYIFISLTPHG